MKVNRLLSAVAMLGAPSIRPSWGQNVDPELVLITSSPFRMVLEPTSVELDHPSLRALEEAASSTILNHQRNERQLMFADAEVVVQQVEYEPVDPAADADTTTALFSTRVRFFVLGSTFIRNATVDNASRQQNLDGLVERTFSSPERQDQFLDLVSSDPILGEATSILVTPILPEPNKSSGKRRSGKLALLDIVLIVMSGLIFLGILYMVIEHHKDRGYIENQRQLALNARPTYYDPNEDQVVTTVHPPQQQPELRIEKVVDKNSNIIMDDQSATPSTPSTTSSFNVNPVTPERVVRITTTTINATDPDVLVSQSPQQPKQQTQEEVHQQQQDEQPEEFSPSLQDDTPENFDNKWFHPANTKPRLVQPTIRPVGVIQEPGEEEDKNNTHGSTSSKGSEDGGFDQEQTNKVDNVDDAMAMIGDAESAAAAIFEDVSSDSSSTGSQESEDLFNVDVASASAKSSADDTNQSIASAASAVSEWMKSIRVVPTTVDQKLSEVTHSTGDGSDEKEQQPSGSGASSTTSSSMDDNSSSIGGSSFSLDQLSMEKSIASSHAEQRPIKKMEV